MSNELKSIFAEGREIELGGSKIQIKQIELQHLPIVVEIVSKIYDANNKVSKMKREDSIKSVIDTLKNDFDMAVKLMVATTNLEEKDVRRLNLGAATLILSEVIEENVDFLLKNVIPSVTGVAEKIKTYGQNKSKS